MRLAQHLAISLPLLLLVLIYPMTGQFVHAAVPTSTTLTVYADGLTVVTQTLGLNSNQTIVSATLISSVLSDIVVTDQAGSALYYQISGNNITVYTLGASEAVIHYETQSLTSKVGTVWSLQFSTEYNTTATLPVGSTLINISSAPVSMTTINQSPVLVLLPGQYTISYGLPITNSTGGGGTGGGNGTKSANTPWYSSYVLDSSVTILVIAGAGTGLFFLLRRRGSGAINLETDNELRPDDLNVLQFIQEKGGKVLEPEIRIRFALPKTSAWRQIKRLERMGYVKVTKIGSQNQVELVKK
ncbi:MAG: hypothetical protein JRN68_10020 [Nitrososphaerota archaeon]|nr:hypothetical protein [Nitrososphaerota archaeon]